MRIEETFKVELPAKVRVVNIRGPIRIEAWEGNTIQVIAEMDESSGNAGRTTIRVEQLADGMVEAVTEYETSFWGIDRPARVDYTVKVPHQTHVRAKNVSGGVVVRGVDGRHKVASVSGGVRLEDITGEITSKTVSGGLKARGLHGPADLNTVSGGLEVLESDVPTLTAASVSGVLTIETPLGEGPYRFSTVSGRVKLVVKEGQGMHVNGRTVSGRLKTNLTGTRGVHERHRWDIDLNGGGPQVTLKSTSGNLVIVTDRDAEAREVRFAEPARADRLDILTRVNNGELSVEEALNKLG